MPDITRRIHVLCVYAGEYLDKFEGEQRAGVLPPSGTRGGEDGPMTSKKLSDHIDMTAVKHNLTKYHCLPLVWDLAGIIGPQNIQVFFYLPIPGIWRLW